EITFEPFGEIEDAFFLWDFGDGSPTSTEKNPKHRYTKLPDNEDNLVTVKLVVTASNGVCTATAEHKIQLFEIIIEVNLEGRDFCENDESSHPFNLGNAGTTVTIDGPGVEQDENGNFVFIPSKAGKGEHTFNVNGEPSDITVTVHEAPVVKFEPNQDGDKMILTNLSTGADSYIWIINEDEIERDDTSPVIIDLKPDSPTRYILQLIALSEICGRVESEKIRFETDPVEPPAENCIEVTTEAILKDLENLQRLNLPGSNFVVPIWMSTSQVYGGTDEFKEGVLNDVDNFLKGNNNEKLPELFLQLLLDTSQMIIELNEDRDGEDYQHLIQLFALQLQLFYNILGCQENEVIEASKDILARMFEQIIAILQQFREQEIKLPESLRAFLENWAEKVPGKGMLEEHAKMILENNLV
ncbi:MAG: hypothetical protein LC658_12505, partial [Bacteroidales bacterium]|nr:hypothetical protein [Bacteroidales bacterium]